ncbi:hypothetical protein HUG17_8054 [Dermatophagoides farinae]|uniref:Uncharacterized protein n=1 Tax=Dermatophagoides farinae TaxID=6954 RepID=A0A9D4SGV0_DERFA|nr:hypothetical protein HUG17_8054 [Dermatophagoides farinae]
MLMKILLIFSAISLIYSMDQNELMSAKKSKINESIVKDPEYRDKLNRKILLRRLLAQLNSNAETLIEKEKREDDIPPGFIGVRGRRFPFTLRDLRSLFHLVPNQKKDASSIYRDGFLGVRG